VTEAPHADVLVIGAGASGGVAAARFADAGMSVVCLEQGDWPDRATYPGSQPDWELRAAHEWSGLPHVRNRPGDTPIDLVDSDLGVVNFNGVGGGTVLYAAQWPRMLPDDFRVRSVDGVADDWPIGYADLQPFSERVDRQFGVSGLGGNPAYPPGADPPLPPLPIGQAGLRIARAHHRLGWHWWPEYNAILSAPYEGRNPCVQRGTCMYGCNEGAKASTDLTHWPRVVAAGGHVVVGARVRRITIDQRGRATGAEWLDRDGREHFQSADVVVCAANAIGTARLLLASASPVHPDGLANGSGLVGRRLMLHPLATVTGLFDEPLGGWRAHAGGLVQCLEFARSDPGRGFVRGAKWALSSAGGPMRAVFAPGPDRFGPGHHRHVRERLGRSALWSVLAEDLPEDANRVELSPTVVDDLGLPVPRIAYRKSENTDRLLAWNIDRARESLTAAGAWRVDVAADLPNGHFMGTARMGDDPASSVVDRWGVAHDVPNLVVVDGSVFVTAGSANPTSTITALALRAAEHLVEHRSDVPRPSPVRSTGGFRRAAGSPPPARPLSVRPPGLADGLRRRFERLADHLIPAGDGMPAASAAGVGGAALDRALAARPDLAPDLRRALEAVGDDGAGEALAALDADGLRAVRYHAAAAYYLVPDVRERLGYEPEPAVPVRALDYPEYLDEGLLDHLVDA
jgi:choline dehydrogenase-like flavoprotein